MKITARLLQISIIMLGIVFLLMGNALSELDILASVNELRSTNVDAWKEFLLPWIEGIPEQ